MIKTQKKLIIFSFNLLIFLSSFSITSAQNEPHYTSLLQGDSIYAGKMLTVQDSVFFDPSLKPTILQTNAVTNMISFRINEYAPLALPDSFEVTIKIRLITTTKDNILDSGTEKTLILNYNKLKSYKNKDICYLHDAYKMQVRILQITSKYAPPDKILKALELENKIEIDRAYVMNPVTGNQMDCSINAIKKITGDISTVEESGELKVTWAPDRIIGMYDVEWAYIDKSALDSKKYSIDGQLITELIFKNNATRITTTGYSCLVPLLYDGEGSLFFRVRGVQKDQNGELITTLWSSDFTGGLGKYDFTGHERKLNWQATTTFAEDAKRKSVVQYFDGSLRSRQTVTRDNTTQTTVVAETLYDQQGRPAIQVMPAPTLSKLIGYTPRFNSGINGSAYDKGKYDTLLPAGGFCGKGAEAMSDMIGANQYYSPNNPLHTESFHQLIPDANGYAFTETQYLPDNTGRINKQGGVGKDFQVGSGHETKYYYATPGQYDLDALFGTEAGQASHYQKNMVRDANGQYSVSYIDMHGRTVATALAGQSPSNLQQLNSYRDSLQTEQLLDRTNNVINGTTIQSTKSLLVPVKGDHILNYTMAADSLTLQDCRQQNICYNCHYDLTITIADDNCNNQLWGGEPLVITKSNFKLFEIDTTCGFAKPLNIDTTVFLEEGSYTITKTLSINKEAMQYYRDSVYLAHNTCLTYEDILTQQKEIVRKNISCDISAETHFKYESYRTDMLMDVYPLIGQYGNKDANSCFSIFGRVPGGPYPYQNTDLIYMDEDGKRDSVMNSQGIRVPPNQLTKDEFIINFKRSWANTLLEIHPEYSLLVKYENYKSSLKWNEDFENTDSYAEAKTKGYLNPTNSLQQPASGFPASNPDPLYTAYPESSLAKQSMERSLFDFQTFEGINVSLWGFATAAGKCPNTNPIDKACIFLWNQQGNSFNESQLCEGELDMAWRFFRAEYLTKKHDWMMSYIKSVAGNPIINFPCTPNFASAIESLQQGGLSGTAQDETAVKDAANKFFEDNSKAFATRWWEQLKAPCSYYAPRDSSIIISYLAEVCKEGADMAHPYGSSTVKPGSTGRFKSFEDVIKFYNDSTGRTTEINCNSYLLDKPLPYNQSAPLVRKDLFTKPEACECTKISEYYNLYLSKTSAYSNFSNFMLKQYSTNISEGSLDSLRRLCDNTISCTYIPKAISLPTIFQCLVEAPCVPCSRVKGLYDSFLVKFPGQIPIKEEQDTIQQKINQVFVSYMNNQLGFSKSTIEYLEFMDSCKNYTSGSSITSGDCDSLQHIFKDYVQNVKPGKVTHVFETQEGPAYTQLSQLIVNGAVQLPDSIRQRADNWYNNYHVNTPKLCTNNGYTAEIRFKFLKNGKTGDVFYSALGIGFTAQRYFGGALNGLTVNVAGKRYYLDADPNALLNWMTFKVTVLPGISYLYYNNKLVFQQHRDSSVPIPNMISFGMGLFGRQGCIDWVKVWDAQDNLKYSEDFNDADNPAGVDPSFICAASVSCETAFTNYFNQKKGLHYTFSQIDSLYFANCGTHPDPCSSPYTLGDTGTINCKQLDSLLNIYLQTNINPASGYVDLEMHTFFGNKTPDEGPKGVFDTNGNLIGNTTDGEAMAIKRSYAAIWNSSNVNTAIGTLTVLQSGRFRLQLNPGQQAPCKGITGQRYYQFDMPVPDQTIATGSLLDGIICTAGTYIDFGDGIKTIADTLLNTASTKTLLSGSGFTGSFWSKPVNDNPGYYVTHQYAQQGIAKVYTVTVYHSDIKGPVGFDNYDVKDATALSEISNLRGYWPQQVTELIFHSTRQASLNTGRNIKNYNQIHTIDQVNFYKGDGHGFNADGHEFTNNAFGSFANHINLRGFWVAYSFATPNDDTPFEASLPPNMATRFPSIEFIRLENPSYHYNPALDFSFPDLHYILIGFPLDPTQADSVIIQAARSKQSNGYLLFRDAAHHTSASDAAIASLIARDWYLSGAGLHNSGNYILPNPVPVNPQPLPAVSAFSDFLNQYFGTALTEQQAFELYQKKCGYIPNTCPSSTSTNEDLMLCGKTEAFNEPFEYVQEDPCADSTNIAIITATERYRIYKDSLSGAFEEAYQQKCLSAVNLESFTIKHPVSEYHYTLYYYDLAGNLIKTIPPEGVHPERNEQWLKEVAQKREDGKRWVPGHTLPTTYRYNSLNQVITQRSPDGGYSEFWYDRLGRLVISRNAQQKKEGKYSYTLYDNLGRITEVGQKVQETSMNNLVARNATQLQNWIETLYRNSKGRLCRAEQVTNTVYDVQDDKARLSTIVPVNQKTYTLRNRVSYTRTYDYLFTSNNGVPRYTDYDYSTTYCYDIHGNVDTLLQQYRTGLMNAHGDNRFKVIAYKYDLISGKVNQVHYQPGQADQLYHRYDYDAENRLTDVYTSDNKAIIGDVNLEEHEAHYEYYQHGPLARTVLGQQKVQSINYAYTLQGWLKGVNTDSTLDNASVGRDAFNYSLHYFKGDYKPIGSAIPIVNASGNAAFKNLYNGNIGAMAVNVKQFAQPLVYNYSYDQLNRLVAMDAYKGWNGVSIFAPGKIKAYHEEVSYDGNGNIKNYKRNGDDARESMDDMIYSYKANSNQLDNVTDAAPDAAAGDYDKYNDIKQGQQNGNYGYDAIGNLVKDAAEKITNIEWSVYGKILNITKASKAKGDVKTINYAYDAAGNRIGKVVKKQGIGASDYTWYVRDASGNVMAVYSYTGTTLGKSTLYLSEQHLYGSSRLGIWKRNINMDKIADDGTVIDLPGRIFSGSFERGNKFFELVNHLGNVWVMVSDKKIGHSTDGRTIDYYNADVISANDYYPFGSLMPGRKYSIANTDYRYGFNGKENDNEVKGEGNQQDYGMRIYDTRLGKFLSVDPIMKEYPELTPYQFASNRPIDGIDMDGLEYAPKGRYGPNQIAVDGTAVKLYPQQPLIIQQTNAKIQFQKTQQYFRISSNKYVSPGQKKINNTRTNDAGYNSNGTEKGWLKLAENQTVKNFANNIVSPMIIMAGASDGIGSAYKIGREILLTARFSSGATKLVSSEQLEKFMSSSTFGYPSNTFVSPTSEIDALLNKGYTREKIAETLGITDKKFLKGDLIRIDVSPDALKNLNLRSTIGNEVGANEAYIKGNKTVGGVTEAIVNGIPKKGAGISKKTIK